MTCSPTRPLTKRETTRSPPPTRTLPTRSPTTRSPPTQPTPPPPPTRGGRGRGFFVWLPEDVAAEAEAAWAADAADDAADRAGEDATAGEARSEAGPRSKVYCDAAYGSGEFQALLEDAGIDSGCRTQSPVASGGRFPKDRFQIDLGAATMTCPAAVTVTVTLRRHATGAAPPVSATPVGPARSPSRAPRRSRGVPSASLPTKRLCSELAPARRARTGRTTIGPHGPRSNENSVISCAANTAAGEPRVRGTTKVDADFNLLAATVNVARLAVAGLRSDGTGGWP